MSQQPLVGFAGIEGHDRACAFLRAAAKQDRLPHALLFAGSDGVGKRAVALALAAWLQCEVGGDDACGSCAACRQVAAGSHPDFQMVGVPSGKKEIGVERAREIKRFVQMQPVSGKSKVAIIDDAHMLTVAAQNALLKTLEEPPARSLLILIANNPDALLATVRSRCQRVHFSPLRTDAVAAILTARRGVDPVAARDLASVSEGSPGRALALSGCGVAERRAQLWETLAGLGTARYVRVMQLAHELSHPEGETTVKLELLLSQYRDAALHAVAATPTAGEAAAVQPPALQPMVRGAEAVHEACAALRRGNPNRQLLLEALLLRLARL